MHNSNNDWKFVTFLVLNLSNPFIWVNLLHSTNICDIFITLEVSKLDKSKVSIFLHNWNIPIICVTVFVFILFIPFIFSNLIQLLNKKAIFSTFDVSKEDKSKETNSLHDWNIPDISFTLLVINLFIPLISFNLKHSLKRVDISITLDVLKFVKSKYFNS